MASSRSPLSRTLSSLQIALLAKKAHKGKSTIQRFWQYVKRGGDNDCWEWTAQKGSGYGRFYMGVPYNRCMAAHRISYMLVHKTVPKGFVVHHLCRNRGCVNPRHLSAISDRENILEGYGLCAQNARKKRCVRGHLLRGSNLLPYCLPKRICRICARMLGREREKRRKVWRVRT